jgi:PucR C-terminal helix-turn-helix domain/GGDEF-like domain
VAERPLSSPTASPTSDHAVIRARLQERRPEIERAAMTRVCAISDPGDVADPAYLEGLRAAVAVAVGYGLDGIEPDGRRAPPVPVVLLAQARVAARNRVSLDTVLRRYFAGYMLLGDHLVEEAEGCSLDAGELKRLLRSQAALFDRLLLAVSEEFAREGRRGDSGDSERRRIELVERLLSGELLETAELAYDLDAEHLGLVAAGARAAEAVRELAAALDTRLLLVCPDERMAWAWFGARRAIDPDRLSGLLGKIWPAGVALALGEPGPGPAAWRLTHRQAAAALPVALRGEERVVHYRDVAMLATILHDEILTTSLRQIYLGPLQAANDGGAVALDTLRAYFAAERNVSSAAAALGVDRRTVASRLRAIEDRIGRSLSGASADLELALRLADLESPSADVQAEEFSLAHPDTLARRAPPRS